jgi:hypothetical protein
MLGASGRFAKLSKQKGLDNQDKKWRFSGWASVGVISAHGVDRSINQGTLPSSRLERVIGLQSIHYRKKNSYKKLYPESTYQGGKS